MSRPRVSPCISLVANCKATLSLVGPGCEERLVEVLEFVVPDSPQFSLQQSLAIETAGEFSVDCAFLQQGGRFGMEQEFSLSCAAVPIALLSNAANIIRMNKLCFICSREYRAWFQNCQIKLTTERGACENHTSLRLSRLPRRGYETKPRVAVSTTMGKRRTHLPTAMRLRWVKTSNDATRCG
jgi:hypothetical protein